MDVDSRWGYRARAVDPLVEVRVVKTGTQRPTRVLVEFIEASFEGKQEWVPPARLKVEWACVEEFSAREQRWRAVAVDSPGRWDTPVLRAASTIFEILIDEKLASEECREGGVCRIHNRVALADYLKVDVKDLVSSEVAFEEDGDLIVPWQTTLFIASRAAQTHQDAVADYLDREERRARHEAIHGHHLASTRGSGMYVTPERSQEFDAEYYRPLRDVLRGWIGTEAPDRVEELHALRAEVARLGALVEQAVAALRARGHAKDARVIESALGTPVDQLRKPEQPD